MAEIENDEIEIFPLADFQYVSFYSAERPAYFDPSAPGVAAKKLAVELFEIKDTEFSPTHPGKYYGASKYGFTFEVHVKTSVAMTLAARNDKNVLHIYQ